MGELRSNGAPLSGQTVRVSVPDGVTPCGEPFKEAVTDTKGCFDVPPVKRFYWLMLVMAHSNFEWDVCVQDASGWQVTHSDRDYTLTSGPHWPPLVLCDLVSTEGGSRFECAYDQEFENSDDGRERWAASTCE